jgi:hypothetical protein
MAYSLLLTIGLPFLSMTVKPLKKDSFQDNSPKTVNSIAGLLADVAFPFYPELLGGVAYSLSLSSSLRTAISSNIEFYGRYYLLGGVGHITQVAVLSPQQATLERPGQLVHEIEPIWSLYAQAGLNVKKFELPQNANTSGKILIEDSSGIERKGTYLGPSFSVGAEYLIETRMRLGLRSFFSTSLTGLENMSVTDLGGALTYSYQIYR